MHNPTFTAAIESGKRSADTQLAKNMNNTLTTAEAAGQRNETFSEAIANIQDAGYTFEKLTPNLNGLSPLLESGTNRIVFIDKDCSPILCSETNKLPKQHNHLCKVAHDAVEVISGTLSTGINVGVNNIQPINYTNNTEAQDIIIRTNGGTLTVNAPLDTVEHHGDAATVNINTIADTSYHENGSTCRFRL